MRLVHVLVFSNGGLFDVSFQDIQKEWERQHVENNDLGLVVVEAMLIQV